MWHFCRFIDDIKMVSFWTRVKELIDSQNTTQEWVATKMGKRPDTFSRWISRDTMPTAEEAYFIASALNTTVEYLVTGKKQGLLSGLSPPIQSLIDVCKTMRPNEIKKLIEIAKICKTQELESTPQTKTG
jgi:transcriptional regulator with XRE-family HTH domain